MKSRSSEKSNMNKKSKQILKKKEHSSNPKKQTNEKTENAKLIDPATQTTKKSDEVYTIDSIEGFMNYNSNPFYLVHWKGYDRPDDMTWEPEKDINNCDTLINKFWTKRFSIHNSKPSSKSSISDGSDKDSNSAVGESNSFSENDSIDGHGFSIIKNQYQEIIRLKKERKDFLKQIKYLKQLQSNNESKEKKSKNFHHDNSNDDANILSSDESDILMQAEIDSDSDTNDSENSTDNDNYDTDVKSKLETGYVPDYILKSRCQNYKQQYLVKWSGFDDKDATWVNEDMIDEQYVKIYRLVYCSPMIKQMQIVFMNEKKSTHQYNVLFNNGQLAWLSEGQIKPKLLTEFNSKKKFNYYFTNS